MLTLAKGTVRHRFLGRIYVAAMAVMLASSLAIQELRNGPSVFHVVTIATTIVLVAAVVAARLRRPQGGWRSRHLRLARLSYLMLVLTFVAQFFDRLPLPSAALNAIVFSRSP